MRFALIVAMLLLVPKSRAEAQPLMCLTDYTCGTAKECKVITIVPNCRKPAKTRPQQSTLTASDCHISRKSMIPAAAIPACETFLESRPASNNSKAEGYFKLGLAYFEHVKGMEYLPWTFYRKQEIRYRLLSEAWNRSLELDPDNVQRLIASANFAAYFTGDYNKSMSAFEKAIALDPENWHAFAGRALIRARSHAQELAIADGERAITLAPQESEAHSSLAFAYMESMQFDDAVAEYRQAAELYKGNDNYSPPLTGSDPWLGLAEVFARQKQYGMAAETLTVRLSTMPNDERPPIYLHVRARYSELARRFGDAADDLSVAQNGTTDRLEAEVPFKRVLMLIKANRGQEARVAAREELSRLTLQELLALQIRLNTAGYKSVQPTGKADDTTQDSFIKCFDDEKCIGALGRAT